MRFTLSSIVTIGLAGLVAARPQLSTTRAISTTPAAPSTTPRAPSTTPAAPSTTPSTTSSTTSSTSSSTTKSTTSSTTSSSSTTSASPVCTIPALACPSPGPSTTYLPEPCFPTTKVCYPTNYYAAQDQGQFTVGADGTIDSQINAKCRAVCDSQPQCLSYVGTENISPNGLATGTCFLYSSQLITPRQCADAPSRVQAYFKQKVCPVVTTTSSTTKSTTTSTSTTKSTTTSSSTTKSTTTSSSTTKSTTSSTTSSSTTSSSTTSSSTTSSSTTSSSTTSSSTTSSSTTSSSTTSSSTTSSSTTSSSTSSTAAPAPTCGPGVTARNQAECNQPPSAFSCCDNSCNTVCAENLYTCYQACDMNDCFSAPYDATYYNDGTCQQFTTDCSVCSPLKSKRLALPLSKRREKVITVYDDRKVMQWT